MIHARLGRPVPVELTDDRRVRGRVARLTGVSIVALGALLGLAIGTLPGLSPVVAGALAVAWLAMPVILAWSLREPGARYLVPVPATLVTLGLLAICVGWLPAAGAVTLGWLLVLAGVAVGGVLGLWLWFRLVPVPRVLDDPFAPGRWVLIAVHVTLVVGGLALVASGMTR